jgi:hypothetical protein
MHSNEVNKTAKIAWQRIKYIVLLVIMIVLGQRRIKEVEQYQKLINEEAENQ